MKRKAASRQLAKFSWLVLASATLFAKQGSADVTIWKSEKGEGGWEVFTNGRVGAFASWARGDGQPLASTYDQSVIPYVKLHDVKEDSGAGLADANAQKYTLLYPDGTASPIEVSRINHVRFRSGMIGNVFGFGVRRNLDLTTKITGYVSILSTIDSQAQKKYFPQYPNAREGYVKIEGSWGSALLGRAATLFNRGAYDADVLYLHGYGVGYTPDLISNIAGLPSYGQVGFGILPNGYAAGFVYATPSLAGLQLSVGLYDPTSFAGSTFPRTKAPRPEFELTADEPLGTTGKLHVYFNGTSQTIYQAGATDDITETVKGIGFGGRVEIGPVHLAAGGHRGTGIGFTYFGNVDSSVMNTTTNQLRDADGYYAIGQLALGKVDVNAGYGISRAKILLNDQLPSSDPAAAINPATGFPDPPISWIKDESAISAAVVFHPADWIHFDIDAMFATFRWGLGEQQKVNFFNAGTTLTW